MRKEKFFNIKSLLVAGISMLLFMATNASATTIFSPKDSSFLHTELPTSFFNQNKIITCYPNPAVSYINFKFDKAPKNSKLYIFSFTGRKMTELSVSNSIIKINLENYFRGLYIYQLRDVADKIIESGKFQVKN